MWGFVVLAVILGILLLPVGIVADYGGQGAKIVLRIGPVSKILYPKIKTRKDKKESDSKDANTARNSEKSGGKLSDFLPLARTMLDFLGNLIRKIRVRDLKLRIMLAESDPCDLSVHYGRTWAAVGGLLPQLDRVFCVQKRQVEVACDYMAEETTVVAHIHASILLVRLIALVVRYGFRILKQYSLLKNNRKGGIGYEPESSKHA